MASYYCPVTKSRSNEPCNCTSSQRYQSIRVPVGTLASIKAPLARGVFNRFIRG